MPQTEAEWRSQPGPWAHLTKEQTDELIAAAVMAERERCAKVLEAKAQELYEMRDPGMANHCRMLAREIREG